MYPPYASLKRLLLAFNLTLILRSKSSETKDAPLRPGICMKIAAANLWRTAKKLEDYVPLRFLHLEGTLSLVARGQIRVRGRS